MKSLDYRTVKFHYFSDKRVTSLVMKWWLKDAYQHTGIELDDGSFVDSTLLYNGVKFREMDAVPVVTHAITVHKDVYDKLLAYIYKVEGKVKYDVKSFILGFGVGTKTQNDNELFCSEFTEVCFELCTGIYVLKDSLTTPEDMCIVTSVYEKLNPVVPKQ